MGYVNAIRVYSWAPTVTPKEFTVLTLMALNSADSDEVPYYWAGQRAIAGFLAGCQDIDAARMYPATEAELHAVKRALSGLTKAGAIDLAVGGTGGRKAWYRVVRDNPATVCNRFNPVDNSGDNYTAPDP